MKGVCCKLRESIKNDKFTDSHSVYINNKVSWHILWASLKGVILKHLVEINQWFLSMQNQLNISKNVWLQSGASYAFIG